MPQHLTYEIHVLRGQDWIIESANECRQTAIYDARQLVETYVVPAAKVVEDRFSPDTGDAQQAVVFYLDRNEKTKPRDQVTFRSRPERVRTGPRQINYKKPFTWERVVHRLMILVMVVGGICIGTLVGVAFLVD
jgi:hypothetical protein